MIERSIEALEAIAPIVEKWPRTADGVMLGENDTVYAESPIGVIEPMWIGVRAIRGGWVEQLHSTYSTRAAAEAAAKGKP